jgi:hypothetical protein
MAALFPSEAVREAEFTGCFLRQMDRPLFLRRGLIRKIKENLEHAIFDKLPPFLSDKYGGYPF